MIIRRRRVGLLLATLLLSACGTVPVAAPSTSEPTPQADSTPQPDPTPYEILGLGDSVVAGSACGCADYVRRLGRLVEQDSGRPVVVDNDGVDGLTSAGLDAQLRGGKLEAKLRRADLVVMTIGANDLVPLLDRWRAGDCDTSCRDQGITVLGRSLRSVLGQARRQSSARVLITTYWNVFVDGTVGASQGPAYQTWSDQLTRAANATICAAARAESAGCVDLYAPFKGTGDRDPSKDLAADGDHPNAAGTVLISQALEEALLADQPGFAGETSTPRSSNQPSTSSR